MQDARRDQPLRDVSTHKLALAENASILFIVLATLSLFACEMVEISMACASSVDLLFKLSSRLLILLDSVSNGTIPLSFYHRVGDLLQLPEVPERDYQQEMRQNRG